VGDETDTVQGAAKFPNLSGKSGIGRIGNKSQSGAIGKRKRKFF
jgi:hypothetical protein